MSASAGRLGVKGYSISITPEVEYTWLFRTPKVVGYKATCSCGHVSTRTSRGLRDMRLSPVGAGWVLDHEHIVKAAPKSALCLRRHPQSGEPCVVDAGHDGPCFGDEGEIWEDPTALCGDRSEDPWGVAHCTKVEGHSGRHREGSLSWDALCGHEYDDEKWGRVTCTKRKGHPNTNPDAHGDGRTIWHTHWRALRDFTNWSSRCGADDGRGARCTRKAGHPGAHSSRDGNGPQWIDCGARAKRPKDAPDVVCDKAAGHEAHHSGFVPGAGTLRYAWRSTWPCGVTWQNLNCDRPVWHDGPHHDGGREWSGYHCNDVEGTETCSRTAGHEGPHSSGGPRGRTWIHPTEQDWVALKDALTASLVEKVDAAVEKHVTRQHPRPRCSATQGHQVDPLQCSREEGHAGMHRRGGLAWETEYCRVLFGTSKPADPNHWLCELRQGHDGQHRAGRVTWWSTMGEASDG